MRLLILGGTRFVGYHMAAEAVARGHDVTIFHRGQTGDRPAGVAEVLGDRRHDLDRVAAERWDAVLDTCGYYPAHVEASARVLQADLYAFVSTISVYQSPLPAHAREDAPLDDALADPLQEPAPMETYGPRKVHCERALRHRPHLIIRPGIVAGPRDATDRFTYWPARCARGGDVAVPGPAERPIQYIDARDLAAWTIQAIEAGRTGPHNVVAPPLTMEAFFTACAASTDARAVWLDLPPEEASKFPLWLEPEDYPFFQIASEVPTRPLAETIRDTLGWLDRPLTTGPTPEAEAKLLGR